MAGSLRYISSFFKKIFCVTELAEVEDVADIISIRHDAHLENQKPKQKVTHKAQAMLQNLESLGGPQTHRCLSLLNISVCADSKVKSFSQKSPASIYLTMEYVVFPQLNVLEPYFPAVCSRKPLFP